MLPEDNTDWLETERATFLTDELQRHLEGLIWRWKFTLHHKVWLLIKYFFPEEHLSKFHE